MSNKGLTKLENKDITKELLGELGAIPNQVEYLIEDALPYDAYTFIEELENGKIDMGLQILFLCMIHALNVCILYESPVSKDVREYQVTYSDSSDNSLEDDYPQGTTNSPNYNYYVFVNKSGSSEVLNSKSNTAQAHFQPMKAHSFQMPTPNQVPIAQPNQLHMTYDASLQNHGE